MSDCKYRRLCEEIHDTKEDREKRKTCDPDHCETWDNMFYGECIALESDGQ